MEAKRPTYESLPSKTPDSAGQRPVMIDFGGEASTLWSRNQKNPGFGRSEGCYDNDDDDDNNNNVFFIGPKNNLKITLQKQRKKMIKMI